MSGEALHAVPESGADVERHGLASAVPQTAKRLDQGAKVARVEFEILRLPIGLWRRVVVLADVARLRQRVRKYEAAPPTTHDRRGHADPPGRPQPLADIQAPTEHPRLADRGGAHVAVRDAVKHVVLSHARSLTVHRRAEIATKRTSRPRALEPPPLQRSPPAGAPVKLT